MDSEYGSMKDTNHQESASPSVDKESRPSATEKMNVGNEFRVVVVGRTGSGKSTLCNALLNAPEDTFQVRQGMTSSSHFKCGVNRQYNLQVVDTPDVFSMGYESDAAARNKFRELESLTPSGIPTAFIFPVRGDERFTQGHYKLIETYIQLLSKKYNNSGILVLINMPQVEVDLRKNYLIELGQNRMFNGRIVYLNQVPSQEEERKKFIDEVMRHIRTITFETNPELRGNSCWESVRATVRAGFCWIGRIWARIRLCVVLLFQLCPYCPRCSRCGRCSCWCNCDDTKPLKP